MPQLKCVGGPRDGYVASIAEGQPHISLADPDDRLASDFSATMTATQLTQIKFTYYTVRRLHGPEGWVLLFLAPEHLSDVEAIKHQFLK